MAQQDQVCAVRTLMDPHGPPPSKQVKAPDKVARGGKVAFHEKKLRTKARTKPSFLLLPASAVVAVVAKPVSLFFFSSPSSSGSARKTRSGGGGVEYLKYKRDLQAEVELKRSIYVVVAAMSVASLLLLPPLLLLHQELCRCRVNYKRPK